MTTSRPLNFISDRPDGLVYGITDIFPQSYHGFCNQHLKNNVRTQIRKKKEDYHTAMECFIQSFHSSTIEGFRDGMDKLKDIGCDGLHEYLSDVPVEY